MLQGQSQNYGVGPAIHLPIFDGDKLKSEYVGATAQIDGAVAGYNAAVVDAVRNVADRLTESCRQVDPLSTNETLERAASPGDVL